MIADTPPPPDPPGGFEAANPLRDDAVRLDGITRGGRPCALIDNTGRALPHAELQALLDALIEADSFGFSVLSAKGGSTLSLDRRESAHVQIAGDLFRLLVHRYEARVEPF